MSETLIIRTNYHPRDVLDAWELTPAEQGQFDYLDWPAIKDGRDDASFFRYRGKLYDLGEFSRWDGTHAGPWTEWDGYQSDSFSTGLLVRYVEEYERVIVARYYAR